MKKIIEQIYTPMKRKQKTPIQIIEKKYGKEPKIKSNKEIKKYLNQTGYKSLSRLLEAK